MYFAFITHLRCNFILSAASELQKQQQNTKETLFLQLK